MHGPSSRLRKFNPIEFTTEKGENEEDGAELRSEKSGD